MPGRSLSGNLIEERAFLRSDGRLNPRQGKGQQHWRTSICSCTPCNLIEYGRVLTNNLDLIKSDSTKIRVPDPAAAACH